MARFRPLGNEQGIALIMALLVLVVMTTVTVSVLTYSSSGVRSVRYIDKSSTARDLAESGIADAESVLNGQNTNASSPTLLGCSVSSQNINNSAAPCTPIAVSNTAGSYSYYGMYNQNSSTGTWTITATGTVANPTGPGVTAIQKTVTAAIGVTGGGQSNNISVWNYVYSTAPNDGNHNTCELTLSGDHDTITVPLYVTGDLCLSGDHSTIEQDTSGGGQAVDVRVMGGITMTGTHSTIGCTTSLGTCTNTSALTSGYSAIGCRETSNGSFHTCSSSTDHWYVGQTDSPLTASPPTLDYTDWYANASPGPDHTCDSALTPPPNLMTTLPHAFDNDGTMNGTNAVFDLTPTTSDYNCVTSSGTLDWNHTTHLLTISGTIFFDGNIDFNDGAASYSGKATIYANGEILFNNGHGAAAGITANCPVSGVPKQCGINNSTWNTTTNMLILVANVSSGTAIDLSVDHSEFQGDLTCPATSTTAINGDHTIVEGGIICGKFTFGDHTQIYPLPTITSLPPGAPIPPNAPATISAPNESD